MPTGYTAQLEEMGYNMEKWLTEAIPRAMGMCVMLREEPNGLSVDEIRARITEDTSYYSSQIEEEKNKIQEYLSKSDKQWELDFNATVQADLKDTSERKKEWFFKKEKHIDSLSKVNKLIDKANIDLVKNVLGFAKSQLEDVITHEYADYCEPKKYNCWSSWKEYKDSKIESSKLSLENSKKHLDKQIKRYQERLVEFDTYISFVESFKDINWGRL